MFYTAAWCFTNEIDFKNAIPFEPLGVSINHFGSSIQFTIVFLEGIDLISDLYLKSLKDLGFNVLDYTQEFTSIISRYPAIQQFYSPYERNCFLRWVAFSEIAKVSNQTQFWHLDSDLVLHTSLDLLAEDTRGKTFMLQGCPVFVSVSTNLWFRQYIEELDKLNSDIVSYSIEANREKELCKAKDVDLANDSLYRNPIGSDQDFLEYLISSGKIYQDQASIIYSSSFYFMQNPLSLKKHHKYQHSCSLNFGECVDGRISIGNKYVPFIHYQNTFTEFASVYIILKTFFFPDFFINKVLHFKIDGATFRVNFLYRILRKFRKLTYNVTRQRVIHTLMKRRKSEIWLLNILNLLAR